MLVRVIGMKVRPERLDEWFRFTRETGFPGMLRQPGCKGIWRARKLGDTDIWQLVQLWESREALDAFRASEAYREMNAGAAPFTEPPYEETLAELFPD